MAHFAKLNNDNIVITVLKGSDHDDGKEDELSARTGDIYKQTSYNTKGGIYYDPETKQPSADQSKAFRKNFAGIGFSYDPILDAFVPPKPYPSWILDEDTCTWKPPVEPEVQEDLHADPPVIIYWSESSLSWKVRPEAPRGAWFFDQENESWFPPVDAPEDIGTGDPPKKYAWDEANTVWVAV